MDSPWTSYTLFLLPALWGSSLLPRFVWDDSSLWIGHVGPIFGMSEEIFLLERLLNKFGLIRVGLEVFWRPIFSLVVAGLRTGPKAHCLTWEFYPYNSPSKFRLLLSYPRRKGGILTFVESFIMDSCFTRAEICFPRASLLLKAFRNPRGANYCA